MKLGDVEKKTNSQGKIYLEFNERATKTRNGQTGGVRDDPPRIFATGGNLDFIKN